MRSFVSALVLSVLCSCSGSGTPAPCSAGTFGAGGDDCSAWSTCGSGSFVTAAGTSTSDRVCASCADGTFSTADNSASCVTWTRCAPGTFISTAGSATSDQRCTGCASGSFSSGDDSASCTTWADCAPGTFVSTAGSDIANQQCTACASGTVSVMPNSAQCVAFDACAAGFVQTASGSSSSQPVCQACAPGTFCAGGEALTQACAFDTWDHDANPASPCVAQADCSPGQAIDAPGDATHARTCRDCASGTFTEAANLASCTGWTTCLPGEFVSGSGSVTSDQTCAACDAGTLSTMPDSAQCVPFDQCPAGTMQTDAGTPTTEPACADCAPGTFCPGAELGAEPCAPGTWDHDANPASPCVAQPDCADGTFVADAGNAVEARWCANCASGSFSVSMNAASCDDWSSCLPGQYEADAGSATGDRRCDACAVGTYCAGGDAGVVTCAPAGVDDDSNPATPCMALPTCGPSTIVAGPPTLDPVPYRGFTSTRFITFNGAPIVSPPTPNPVMGDVANTLDATALIDPNTCDQSSMRYKWVVTYIRDDGTEVSPYADVGITGYLTPILTINEDSMPAGEGSVVLNAWSTANPSARFVQRFNLEIDSNTRLQISYYLQCQATNALCDVTTPGCLCFIANALPTTEPTQ